jgi:threonyl-tRNA synthetase
MNREDVVKNIKSRHLILLPDGKEFEIDISSLDKAKAVLDQINNPELNAYVLSEEVKGQPKNEPPSIKAMQQQEFVAYEPSSDAGHFSLYPKGHLIFELLKDWAAEIAVNRIGAIQIDSPIIYNWADPEIRGQASSFHERHYIVRVPDNPEKEFILRFAGDFGLFKLIKKAKFSYRMLPLRAYEFSKSFRYEKRGELAGFRRLRGFHMPDVH